MQERLQKIISRSGAASRRAAEKPAEAGTVDFTRLMTEGLDEDRSKPSRVGRTPSDLATIQDNRSSVS